MKEQIIIRGAREHNLKGFDLVIPRDRLVVITGLSGSGKSSLAFDTIYAEGQRRYVESLSAYARQFLEQMDKPDVESIEGLSPASAIEQKMTGPNPRSTVGTVTEIYDYLRLLFARIGQPHCPACGKPIAAQTVQQMVDTVRDLPPGTRLLVLSPIVRGRKGEYRKELQQMQRLGFVRARVDGRIRELGEPIPLDKNKKHTIEVVVDRLVLKDGVEGRLAESLELALRHAGGVAVVHLLEEQRDILFSARHACVECGVSLPELTPRFFSFNSPHGACPLCNGLGEEERMEPGSQAPCEAALLSGRPCPSCGGSRLRPESLAVRVAGCSIGDCCRLSIERARAFFYDLRLTEREAFIAQRPLKVVRERLGFLLQVGLGYLTLDRPAGTLSGGEGQRIRLATQIGSSLVGVLYILDEPSIGLHQRDNAKLLETLCRLRDMGNTVLVVEHDEETIRRADHVIDMGPGAGIHGGEIVAQGPPEFLARHPASLTGAYLSDRLRIPLPATRRKATRFLEILGATEHNLKDLDVRIPLGVFTGITGVSGSGKSTLLLEILYRALARRLYRSPEPPGAHQAIKGMEQIDKIIDIDQSPIGRTPRSNPATYTGVFTPIRALFAALPESRMRGYRPGRYSFNVKGGRCEACEGGGLIKIEMHFLPPVYVTCEACKGTRYGRETLEVRYKGAHIADALAMTVSQALEFFAAVPTLREKLRTLEDVGLGYLTLGQSATTLSGGEAQRVKLSRELAKRATGRTLYILDEPTTGLHFADIHRLLEVLNRLIDAGNTVLVIEHHPDVIKSADYLIDLGPEGGEAGGHLVAAGTPEEVARVGGSHTGALLRKILS
ncbi:MAG: excinuclease ABC subunit UvrA [Nitrospirae bacterium]|nr:excinuclease ABC subunit UvrA [Nitrospirota bacterium]